LRLCTDVCTRTLPRGENLSNFELARHHGFKTARIYRFRGVPMKPAFKPLPTLPCVYATLRRADRAVTALYDSQLRASGYRATQFTLLQVLLLSGEINQRRLGETLALDSTTLTRSLAPLFGSGLITGRPGTDRRERLLRLTPKGKREHRRLTRHWDQAQRILRTEMGDTALETLRSLLDSLASVLRSEPRG